MFKFTSKGDFRNIERFIKEQLRADRYRLLQEYGQRGVDALAASTPKNSGVTASSWSYVIEDDRGKLLLHWINTNTNDGVNIAIILQYGHATGTGGWVAGEDYINPTVRPIFDQIAEDIWKTVIST